MMKKIVLLLCSVSFLLCLSAQNYTENPYVERQEKSVYGEANIRGIYIDNEQTVVAWEYITSPRCYECWLTLSSTTILSSPKLQKPLKITGWGILMDDNDVNFLNLNEKYTVDADRHYVLFMSFPPIPAGIEVANISTNTGTNDLVWQGIHFNNSRQVYSNTASYSGNDFEKLDHAKTFERSEEFEMRGSGSCFAVSSNGILATCYHVVEEADRIQVRGVNGDFDTPLAAKVVAVDRNNDLALVKITDDKSTSISGIPYRLSNNVTDVGTEVYALGYPLRAIMGDEIKLTNGLISSRSGYQGDITSYQISVAVQSGNSGCPLFDKNGNVIGVVNSRLEVESAAYAIKSSYLKSLINSVDPPLVLPTANTLAGKSLAEQVKSSKKYIYILEIE